MSNIYDLYTIEELVRISDIYDKDNSKYLPIVPVQDGKDYHAVHGSINVLNMQASALCEEYTLKFHYALKVWKTVVGIFSDKAVYAYPNGFSYRFQYTWKADVNGFNKLITNNPNYEVLVKEFWHLLEEVANSQVIKVCEGVNQKIRISSHDTDSHDLVIEVVKNVATVSALRCDDVYKRNYDYTPKSFTWNEIKEYFRELSLKEIALLDYHKLHKQTDVDKKFLTACGKMDFDGIEKALREGANIHALSVDGENCITLVVQEAYNYYLDDDSYDDEFDKCQQSKSIMARGIISYLLTKGAALNEFGVCTLGALEEAILNHDYEMTEFLLRNGANPNFYTEIEDMLVWGNRTMIFKSTALDVAIDEDSEILGYKDENSGKIYNLLIDYGAELYDEKTLAEHPDWKNPTKE